MRHNRDAGTSHSFLTRILIRIIFLPLRRNHFFIRCASYILFIVLLFSFQPAVAQNDCRIKNIPFAGGEELVYEIYYHWGLIWANAGEATFTAKKEQTRNRNAFHFIGEGHTYKSYDWVFKVRDKFESWADSATLFPSRYIRKTSEGSTYTYNDNYFNYNRKHVVCYKINGEKIQKDTIAINSCTFDVLTMIFYSRCIDFSNYQPDTKIPISLYLDGEMYDKLYIRYVGKEKIETELGEFNCIVFKPLLIQGTIFSGGEEMTVWVTDDDKKIPVLIKTPIVVGDIQARIKAIK